jgi:hypothetical protein
VSARALIDFVGTFACPRIIHSDRGTQFVNDMITSLVTEGFAAFQRVTTTASKEENAIVERANKEVNRHLTAFVFDIASSVRWSFGLPMIQRIINTTIHSGIRHSTYPVGICIPTWTEVYTVRVDNAR